MSGLAPPNSLSYTGQVAVPSINRTFPPTSSFNDFNVPTIWTDTLAMNAYILVAKPQGVAEWVLIGGEPGALQTITGDSGGALTPDAGNINILGGSTGLTTSGSGSTLSLTGTLNVAHGGTGDTSLTAYAVLCGGTTSTNPVQSIASVGTAGQALVSNGAGLLPTFQAIGATGAFSQVKVTTFTSTGTYTATANTKYVIVECIGGGGGSGGVASVGAGQCAVSGGGGGGGYARKFLTFAQANSQAITIGAAGAAGTNAPTNGGNGGTTSLGSLCVASGGLGSGSSAATTSAFLTQVGGAGGIGTTGDLLVSGGSGDCGMASGTTNNVGSGTGGSSYFGGGALSIVSAGAGNIGTQYGGGASGAASVNSSGASAGSAGFQGVIVITEFI